MNNSGNKESSQFWQQSGFSTTFSKSAGIQIDKVIEPVMNDNIPLSIVRAELNRVPPIRIEASVWKFRPSSSSNYAKIQRILALRKR